MDVIRMLLVKCCNEWCVVLNHYGLGLYAESWLKSFVISGLSGLWELKYRNLITSVIVFVLTFLWFGRFCYNTCALWWDTLLLVIWNQGWRSWIITIWVCMSRVGWNPSWFPDYRDYGILSTGIWLLRWLFLYLRSYDLVGSVTP